MITRRSIAMTLTATLALSGMVGCNRTTPDTCNALSVALTAPKPPKPRVVTKPKKVKEGKRDGDGTVIVDTDPITDPIVASDDDDDCDD